MKSAPDEKPWVIKMVAYAKKNYVAAREVLYGGP